jgi:hypothetical protein
MSRWTRNFAKDGWVTVLKEGDPPVVGEVSDAELKSFERLARIDGVDTLRGISGDERLDAVLTMKQNPHLRYIGWSNDPMFTGEPAEPPITGHVAGPDA